MKTLKYIAIVTMAIAVVSCSKSGEKTSPETVNADSVKAAKVYPVRIQELAVQSIPTVLEQEASLVAYKEIHYAPASPGRIEKINVEVGDRVVKGQVIAEMDKTQLSQAATQYTTAKSAFQRIDTLYQLGSISEQQYETSQSQYELAKSNYDFLKENVMLVSPINGIVTNKYFESKELYSAAPNTAAGKAAIVTLMQINPLKAMVGVSQTYFPAVKEGMKVIATTEVLPGKIFEGSINKVYPVIDPATRTFQVEVVIKNPKEELRPGMYTELKIDLGSKEAMAVPAVALLKQEGTNNRYIYVNNNGVAHQIEVHPGTRYNDLIELKDKSVKVGMQLITEGQANLINGSKVKVVK